MTLIKKRDVKEYFAGRKLQATGIHAVPASRLDATVNLVNELPVESKPMEFSQDFTADHSSPGAFARLVGRHEPFQASAAPSDVQE